MLQRSRQSVLVGLTAGLLLAGAGAYAISLNGIRQPMSGDLPVITFTRLVGAIDAAPDARTTPSVAATNAPDLPQAEKPRAGLTTAKTTPKREVITPEVREEDTHDDSEDDRLPDETPPAVNSDDGESSSEDTSTEYDD